MTYYYRGEEVGQREETVGFILTLPSNELQNFVYTYLDQFNEEHLKDLIWVSVDSRGWTMRDLIEDALLIMEGDWESMYSMDSMTEGETVSLGDFDYEDWEVEE